MLSILLSGLSFAAAKPKSIEREVFDGGKSFFVKAFLSSKIEYKKNGSKKVSLYDKDGKVDYCHIYDSFGNQIYYRDRIHKISTKIKYDSDGRVLSKKDSDGVFAVFEYDADGKGAFSKSTSDGKNFSYWFAERKFYKDGREKEICTYVSRAE